jgi:hypothetical protein
MQNKRGFISLKCCYPSGDFGWLPLHPKLEMETPLTTTEISKESKVGAEAVKW